MSTEASQAAAAAAAEEKVAAAALGEEEEEEEEVSHNFLPKCRLHRALWLVLLGPVHMVGMLLVPRFLGQIEDTLILLVHGATALFHRPLRTERGVHRTAPCNLHWYK